MKKLLFLTLAALPLLLFSCSKDEGVADNPSTANLSKHWFVRVQGPAATSAYTLFSTRPMTVNVVVDTLGNVQQKTLTDTLVLDDHNLLVPSLRANVRIDAALRTFGAGLYRNWHNATDSVLVKEGKIIRLGGKSRSGVTVDSIYLKYAFKSAPATDYILNGHERTGLVADEY